MSVFSDPVDHWLPIDSLFANTARFYPQRGFADSPLDESRTCEANCELFSDANDRSECREYCDRAQAHFLDSLRPVADACLGSTDPLCCKKHAGTNDFAFRFCEQERGRHRRSHQKIVLGGTTILCMTALVLMFLMLGVLVIIFVSE